MSDVSTAVESSQAPASARGAKAKAAAAARDRRAALDSAAADASPSFAIQGTIGFLAGGLVAVIFAGASALPPFENLEVVGRFLGYALGGAIGGAALAWGSSRKHASRTAAFGFALALLIPAYIVGPALNQLLTLKPEAYGFGTFVGTVMAFTIAFGIAGAIGGALVLPRLFWAGMVRFGLAAAVGGIVAAIVPSFDWSGPNVSFGHFIGLMATLLAGHLIPFVLGGFWFGRALAAEERVLRQSRNARRS